VKARVLYSIFSHETDIIDPKPTTRLRSLAVWFFVSHKNSQSIKSPRSRSLPWYMHENDVPDADISVKSSFPIRVHDPLKAMCEVALG
jgi:hypothetical protein